MTEIETLKILSVLKAAYPAFYRDMADDEVDGIIALWQEMFSQEDYALVSASVKALLAGDTKGFPPHIGAVKSRIRLLTHPQEITEGEAWALVAKAIRNSAYDSSAEFERLPESVRRGVGSPSQLKEWAMMDSDTVHSVVASNFQRSFRDRAQKNREFDALPPDVRSLITGIGALPGGRDGD